MADQGAAMSILALDVGDKRIGVAIASSPARLPRPLTTLVRGEATLTDIGTLIAQHHARSLVIGLPRGLNGQETAQTASVREFVDDVAQAVSVPVHWQDEALTSRQAETELESRGKPYSKSDIDALSATYILEDFMRDNPKILT